MIFVGHQEWRLLAGRHFGEKDKMAPFGPIMYDTTFFKYLLGRESDSEFIFTICHKRNPHCGVKLHISANGICESGPCFRIVSTICGQHFSL